MSQGAVMNYDFGPKRNWRRWVWNRIAERVTARQALCIYLPGKDNFDLGIASDKGFRSENLIAVERDHKITRILRSNNILTIDAEFCDAVEAVAINRKLDVVFGDFCHGLEIQFVSRAKLWLGHPNLSNTTFCFNLMRGRDASSNEFRKSAQKWMGLPVEQEKNRARLLLLGYINYLSLIYLRSHCGIELDAHRDVLIAALEVDDNWRRFSEVFARFYDLLRPAWQTYKSESGQVFDSVVFTNCLDVGQGCMNIWKEQAGRDHMKRARGSVAAVMAHRTRRMA